MTFGCTPLPPGNFDKCAMALRMLDVIINADEEIVSRDDQLLR